LSKKATGLNDCYMTCVTIINEICFGLIWGFVARFIFNITITFLERFILLYIKQLLVGDKYFSKYKKILLVVYMCVGVRMCHLS
jgi:predicted PurR-regulated permease PerM